MSTKPRKKFKETKVGQFLLKKLPGIVGDVLPDKGALGIVKNLIDNDPEITPEEKIQMHDELVKLYELEVADRDSARKREVEVKKTGDYDFMMLATGLSGLASFIFIIYAVVYEPAVLENDLFVHLMGMVEGVVISNIFAYYYGTSAQNRQ
ncbi:hypothetical protein [Winogradskyella sp.]|uniref:hypothetical protein n=1 Tax=Winogradskyella sp. TaxID=1883156 RepID=UPI003511ECE2